MSRGTAARIAVQGRIAGVWGRVERAKQTVAFLPDPLGLRHHVPGIRVRLALPTPSGQAHLECEGSTWRNLHRELRVVRMRPDPWPWLRDFLTDAGRTLDAHGSQIPTAQVAWAIARLRLIFDRGDDASDAVRQGLQHLRATRTADVDVADLRLLHRQLSTCGCGAAAEDLSAYLAAVRPG